VVKLSASTVYCLLANAALLNVRGFVDLQKLYLSSAKAAPQKILCLLAYFYCGSEVKAACDREVVFEKAMSSRESIRRYLPDPTSPPPVDAKETEGQVGSPQMQSELQEQAEQADSWADEESGGEGESLPDVTFTSDFATSLDGSQGAIILLSSAGSFGAVADVKTPPEEVPLWEMPELLCSKLVLGSLPLADGEVVVVRSVRRWNSCMTDGPLLHLAEDRPPETLLDIAVMDIQRHIDDRRFAIESLRHDSAKWSSCFRHLAKDIVAVSHPPLIGVDRHWSYAMQLLAAGHCQVSGSVTKPKLRYALSTEGYATAAASTELSPAQVKEAKHLEALTGRMVSWTPRDLIRLLALFPFARAGDAKFHAFWTQRLRDKTLGNGGRPQKSEV
ncbi:rpsF, partial [Symbiodinium necroappetens]